MVGGCAKTPKEGEADAARADKYPLERSVTDIKLSSKPVRPITPAAPSFVSATPATPAYDAYAYASPTQMSMPSPSQPQFVPADSSQFVTYTPPPLPEPTRHIAPAAGRSYQVQKGDTLFRIAHTHYGNGNQWSRIASANPGLSPATLKAGTTIVVP
jgi:5'-nucleotidase